MPKNTSKVPQLTDKEWFHVADCLHIARTQFESAVEDIERLSPRANFAEVLRTRAELAEDIREKIKSALL